VTRLNLDKEVSMYIVNKCRVVEKRCRAFRRGCFYGYLFTNRGYFIWCDSFASGIRISLCNNLNQVQSFRR
jgi:hypothetical protein